MKEEQRETTGYEAPRVEVVEVEVEAGFALSAGAKTWNNGTDGDLVTD